MERLRLWIPVCILTLAVSTPVCLSGRSGIVSEKDQAASVPLTGITEKDPAAPSDAQEPVASSVAASAIPAFTLIAVPAGRYHIPIGRDDSDRDEVSGGFMIGETEVTYELWYAVRIWAEAHGYRFQHPGTEGCGGADPSIPGAPPTSRSREPVSRVSWRDVVAWCNALSEMKGREPVYRTPSGIVVRDSRNVPSAPLRQDDIDTVLQTDNDGYRLPTNLEWELAARYIDGVHWTPGDYASGASDSTANWLNNLEATWAVAVFGAHSRGLAIRFGVTLPVRTAEVASKTPNALGIYDMSGNVWEWTFTASERQPYTRGRRGGDWTDQPWNVAVGGEKSSFYTAKWEHNTGGFRLARSGSAD